jgi:hypothetical protein
MAPKLRATAVGVDSAAARISNDSVRTNALDHQSNLYAVLNGPGSITAGAIGPPALTRKSCAPSAAAWANHTHLLTTTFAEPAAGQGRGPLLTVDNLLLNTDATGALVAVEETALDSPGHQLQGYSGNDNHCARRYHARAAKEMGIDKATKTTKGGNDLCLT